MRIYNLWRLKKHFRRYVSEKGVSLVEVIIIVLLLSISVYPLSRLAISNLDSGRVYNLIMVGTFYAQEIMERLIADYMANSRGYQWVLDNWPSTVTGSPEGYTGEVSFSTPSTVNGVTYVTATVTVSANGIPDITLSTLLASGVDF